MVPDFIGHNSRPSVGTEPAGKKGRDLAEARSSAAALGAGSAAFQAAGSAVESWRRDATIRRRDGGKCRTQADRVEHREQAANIEYGPPCQIGRYEQTVRRAGFDLASEVR